ncbi:MAG: hypothetical protein HQL68_09390 [Magnetococcales bacterium]|nr:hypothetical protein [Magnetococcales bacterium]
MNGLDPNLMTAEERLDEMADILAAGFSRWKRKETKKKQRKENDSLDLPSKTRLHVSETNTNFGGET